MTDSTRHARGGPTGGGAPGGQDLDDHLRAALGPGDPVDGPLSRAQFLARGRTRLARRRATMAGGAGLGVVVLAVALAVGLSPSSTPDRAALRALPSAPATGTGSAHGAGVPPSTAVPAAAGPANRRPTSGGAATSGRQAVQGPSATSTSTSAAACTTLAVGRASAACAGSITSDATVPSLGYGALQSGPPTTDARTAVSVVAGQRVTVVLPATYGIWSNPVQTSTPTPVSSPSKLADEFENTDASASLLTPIARSHRPHTASGGPTRPLTARRLVISYVASRPGTVDLTARTVGSCPAASGTPVPTARCNSGGYTWTVRLTIRRPTGSPAAP